MTISPELLERASRQSAATVHEAAKSVGALPSAIRPVASHHRVCGPAFTVEGPPIDNLWIHRAIYAAKPGDVLVVVTGGGHEAGYWGEILNTAAIARGLGGLVIDGGVRDLDALSASDFGIFSRRIAIQGTGKDFEAVGRLGQSIIFGDLPINRGDLVIGDSDGVVAIAADRVEEVITLSEQRVLDEEKAMERIRSGERTIDIYNFGE